MKKLISLVDERNETIDELKATISKSENEHFAKKETIFNLWMIEFKEFKENLITITDIKGIVEKFKIEGGELKIQRDKLINEEIYLLRQEIKTKDKSISDLKSNYKKENSNLNEVLEQYRKGIEGRISSLELMLTQRGNEITALRNEKERVLGIEKRKKELTESELILWAEQKESIKVFLQEHMNSKDKEIQILKLAVETMQTELDFSKKSYDEAMDNLIKSNETQIQLIKERENFTTKQLLELEQKMKNFREEKEKLINLLKSEIEELRANNVLISKLRNDKLMQEDKPISTSPNNKDERNRDDDGRENDDKFK
jgi:DNA repair exonuclease SbcCD ATPase subunit